MDASVDLYGGGGLMSTCGDLARFFRGLLRGDVFREPATLETMTSTLVDVPLADGVGDEDDPSSAAMFLFRAEIGGEAWWGHDGFWGTTAYTCPARDVTIVAGHQRSGMPDGFSRMAILGDAFELVTAAPNCLVSRPSSDPLRLGSDLRVRALVPLRRSLPSRCEPDHAPSRHPVHRRPRPWPRLRAMTTYPLSAEDREIQERARRFVDEELIPWEEHAEADGGHIPEDERAKHHDRAIELGFYAMNMPKELGGTGMTTLQQVLVSEQIGRVTNALGWCVHTPPAWAPAVVDDHQMQTWILPTIRGEQHECYAITEAGAGSDVDAIEATARRDGDGYVLNGEKMHVTSFNGATYCFFQAKIVGGPHEGEHAMFFVDKETPGVRLVREPAYTHTYPDTHAIVAFEDVRVPAANLVGAGGRRHGVHVRVVPLRAADDRRPLLRRRRAPDRRGHRVRAAARAVRAARSSSTRRSRTCSPTRSPSSGRRA